MTSSTFDLNAAEQKAAAQSQDALVTAAGDALISFKRLLMNVIDAPSMSNKQKVTVLNQMEEQALPRLEQALSGNPRALNALGSSQSAASRSGDEDADLRDQLNRAETQIEQQRRDLDLLRSAVAATGATVPADSVPSDIVDRAEKSIKKREEDAKASVRSADQVDKAGIRPIVDQFKEAWNASETEKRGSFSSRRTLRVFQEPDSTKLEEAINTLDQLSS